MKRRRKENNILKCKNIFCDDCYYEFLKEKINTYIIEKIKCSHKDCTIKLFDAFIEKNYIKIYHY